MHIKQLILGKFYQKTLPKSKIGDNPYTKGAEGRQEWNDRYMNMKKMIARWQIAFFVSIGAVFVLAICIGKIASQSKVQPFIVETNQGMPYAVKAMGAISPDDHRLVNFALNQFIINARTIISDTDAEKSLLNKLYAYTADNAIPFLRDYYAKNNPFEIASHNTVTVNIINSLPISKNTWQITWDETRHDTNNNNVLGVSRWVASVTYKFGDVNETHINDNPFGLYITQLTWSQSQT